MNMFKKFLARLDFNRRLSVPEADHALLISVNDALDRTDSVAEMAHDNASAAMVDIHALSEGLDDVNAKVDENIVRIETRFGELVRRGAIKDAAVAYAEAQLAAGLPVIERDAIGGIGGGNSIRYVQRTFERMGLVKTKMDGRNVWVLAEEPGRIQVAA